MSYDLIKQLLDKLELYESAVSNTKPISIYDFAQWALADASTVSNHREAFVEPIDTEGTARRGGIGALIGLMHRYAKNYTKKALKNTPIQTIEEFTYMATLLERPVTKSQAIDKHAQEKTTGMAIIQRLLRQGWIEQTENEADGRSHIIQLTDLGHSILRGGFSEMLKVSRIVEAHLTADEKVVLMRILEKLDAFHRTVFDNEKNTELDTIIEKYKL